MAHKRMFSKDITESDAFADMPLSSQALYFHLGMSADDDGFINNPKKIQRSIGASADDLNLLMAKNFVIPFDSGVVVIKHWRINNTVRSDRYCPTKYQEEFRQLAIKENKAYTLTNMHPELVVSQRLELGIPNSNQLAPQNRIEEDRIEEKRIDTMSGKPDRSSSKVSEVIDYLNAVLGTNYRASSKKNATLINARFKEGFTVEDFKSVIDKKSSSWQGTDMAKYLRPETLFGTKFEGYLNELTVKRGGANGRFSKYD